MGQEPKIQVKHFWKVPQGIGAMNPAQTGIQTKEKLNVG
jgi:hypothetical protein